MNFLLNFRLVIIVLGFYIFEFHGFRFYRIIFDKEGADWTFICPPDYKNITYKSRRIKAFYRDGIGAISEFLSEIGYFCDIRIPKRYKRHFDIMLEDE